jgi:N-formylglutamate amidohydrolase
VGAAEIYALQGEVAALVTTDIARAIVDMSRAENDRRPDGVVKTHTCWNVPVYRQFPPDAVIEALLARYHRPYHGRLTAAAQQDVVLGIDCHTMAAKGPPIGPGPAVERPRVCLSNADGTCPEDWLKSLAGCIERAFACPVSLNDPFKGGFIIRSHAHELPWVQLELSRAPFLIPAQKRRRALDALGEWCRRA